MSAGDRQGGDRAAALAREFDQSFAAPPRAHVDDAVEDLLALRAGTDTCVVRLSDTRGLVAKPVVIALPSPVPELLGLAGLRGALLPVYRLATLQGQPVPDDAAAWMILVEADGLVGLAFEELLGYVRIDRSEIAVLAGEDGAGGTRQAARVGGTLRPLVNMALLVADLKRRAGVVGAQKEE